MHKNTFSKKDSEWKKEFDCRVVGGGSKRYGSVFVIDRMSRFCFVCYVKILICCMNIKKNLGVHKIGAHNF